MILESSPYKGESDELFSVCISNNNKFFATGGMLGIVRIYDYNTGQFITQCKAHSNSIMSVKFSPDDKQLVSAGTDGLVAIWNVFL
jgi:WD40 repeat protein